MSKSHLSAIKEAARDVGNLDAYLLDFSKLDFSDILETLPMHACEAETSLMLYLHPDKVTMEKAVDENIRTEKYSIKEGLKRTSSGVFGSPTKATKEKGKAIFERIIKEFVEVINEKSRRSYENDRSVSQQPHG